jgi:hypothetical protein
MKEKLNSETQDQFVLTLYGEDEMDTLEMMVNEDALNRLQQWGIVKAEDVHEDIDPEGYSEFKYAYGDLYAYDSLQEHLEAVSR